jgi:hypothetical protein
MKKNLLVTLPVFLLIVNLCSAQKVVEEYYPVSSRNPDKVFVPVNPSQDKTDLFEITGIGNVIYTTSNVADATANSYKHSLKITIELFTTKNKTGNYQLIFSSPEEKIPYSASFVNDMLNIYYPLSVYEGIREKLDQAFAAKKKVQIKVIQKTNGYREGTLIL